jgi:hypothetical protein
VFPALRALPLNVPTFIFPPSLDLSFLSFVCQMAVLTERMPHLSRSAAAPCALRRLPPSREVAAISPCGRRRVPGKHSLMFQPGPPADKAHIPSTSKASPPWRRPPGPGPPRSKVAGGRGSFCDEVSSKPVQPEGVRSFRSASWPTVIPICRILENTGAIPVYCPNLSSA